MCVPSRGSILAGTGGRSFQRSPFTPTTGACGRATELEFARSATRPEGSPGIRAPVTVVQAFEFQVSVDCKGAQEFLDLDGFLTFPVMAGPAVRLVAIAPSDVQAGEPFAVRARFEDVWGNPTEVLGASLADRDV